MLNPARYEAVTKVARIQHPIQFVENKIVVLCIVLVFCMVWFEANKR